MSPTRQRPGQTSPGTIQTATTKQQADTETTARLSRWSPAARYLAGREAVLGRQLRLHQIPEVAATLLVEQLGPASARAWARRLLAELDGGGA
jgi:putative intracellular protease/amidase